MVNVGLIGCGRISRMHFSSMKSFPDFQLKAVCDIDENVLNEHMEKYQVDGYTDYHKLIQRDDLDLVVICTPNGLHYPMARDAFLAGKHVLLEKPIALNTREADQLIQVAEKSGKHFFAVKQVRYNPPILVLRDAIQNGHFGRLFSASLVIRWTRPQEYYEQSSWRGTKKLDGGSLLNQGIHYVDIMQWLLGDAESVYGKVDTVNHDIEIEDEAFGLIKFQNGVYATIEFSVNTYPHNLECSLTVMGEKGTVKLSGSAMNEIEIWHVKDYPKPAVGTGFPPNIYAGGLYQGSCPNHIYIYQDILRVLQDGNGHYIDGREARKSLMLVEKLYQSAQEGREVFMNE